MTRETEAEPTFSATGAHATNAARGRLRSAFGGRRGSAQLGVLVAAAAVAGGLVIGTGVAAHSATTGDNTAWIGDGKRGQVVQVDPVVGRTNVRLQVAKPGAALDIQQADGRLVVVDHSTGRVTSIDLGTLLVSGNRAVPSGSQAKVLLDGNQMYVANLANGSIQAVDPQSEASVGTPWGAGTPLVDVGIDGQHHVWALGTDQQLISLQWSPGKGTLVPISNQVLAGTGAGSVIVGHPRGVTVVGAQGTIARVGTGDDSTITSPQVHGPMTAPTTSPTGLVPVANPGNSSVVIVGNSGAVVDQIASLGCSTPGSPVVFDGKVYVPCLGAGIVLVLDQRGTQTADPIQAPGGGDPQLTISDGQLIVSAPGSGTATVVDGSGGTRTFPTIDPTTPVQNPNTPPPPPPTPPAPTPTPTKHHGDPGSGGGHHGAGPPGPQPGGGSDPSSAPSSGAPSSSAPGDHGGASASADARTDGTVLVSWTGPDAPGGFTVTAGGTTVAQVPAGSTSAVVTVLSPGTTTSFVVQAWADAGQRHARWSASTPAVTVGGQQVTVSNITYSASTPSAGVTTLSVSWAGAVAGGQISYTATADVNGTATSATTATTQTSLQVACANGCSGTLTVTPSTPSGQGTPAKRDFTVAAVPAPAPDPTPAPAPAPVSVPLPNAGESMLTARSTPGNATDGTDPVITITVTTPADWSSWTDGTCALIEDSSASQTVPCSANGAPYDYTYTVAGSHTYLLRATSTDGRTSDSASVTATARYLVTGPGCNFLSIPGISQRMPCQPICTSAPCPLPNFVAPEVQQLPAALRIGWVW